MINFKSLTDLIAAFPDEKSCLEYLEKLRWPTLVTSPFTEQREREINIRLGNIDANSTEAHELLKEHAKYNVYKYKNGKYKCAYTKKYFNAKTGTMFENSKLPLQKWFIAIYLLTTHKKGISSLRLAEHIGTTQKTAWFIMHRIRNCCNIQHADKMQGTIEADETFVGGKNANRHMSKRVAKSHGRSFKDKTPVLGILERETKQVKLIALPSTSKENIQPMIHRFVERGSTFYSDEWRGYSGLNLYFDHHIIDHKVYQYVSGENNEIHTNTIEGFWTIFKRGYMGVYHKMSPRHLQKYCYEFAFRYNVNHLTAEQKFRLLLSNMGNRLKYKDLIKWIL